MAIASCDANNIKFFGNDYWVITKEEAALMVVILDLIMIVFFWLALIFVKPFIGLTEEEINSNTLTGPNFTLMITNQ